MFIGFALSHEQYATRLNEINVANSIVVVSIDIVAPYACCDRFFFLRILGLHFELGNSNGFSLKLDEFYRVMHLQKFECFFGWSLEIGKLEKKRHEN